MVTSSIGLSICIYAFTFDFSESGLSIPSCLRFTAFT